MRLFAVERVLIFHSFFLLGAQFNITGFMVFGLKGRLYARISEM
jgi:hypothetical protein